MSAISDKHAALGGAKGLLGKPTTKEAPCADHVGRFRRYEHGTIYWHPNSGAHEVHGLIGAKYAKLGAEHSALGYPKSDERESASGGRFNLFQFGAILWKSGAKEAFEIHGAIRDKHGELDFEHGFLGWPTTDETSTPDGVGRFNHFEGGSIYWKPSLGAHEVHGDIRRLWAKLGWERNKDLGYPISDERRAKAASKDRFSDFENGVVFWRASDSTAMVLSKLMFDDTSQTAAQVLDKVNSIVRPLVLKEVDGHQVYERSAPVLLPVTDYAVKGTKVRNRMYTWRTSLGIEVDMSADIDVTLDLSIEVLLNGKRTQVLAVPRKWWAQVSVPFPTSVGTSASEVMAKLKPSITPHMNKKHVISEIPDGVNILSVKTQLNGDLDVFMAPLG